jgi:hypothetical protein
MTEHHRRSGVCQPRGNPEEGAAPQRDGVTQDPDGRQNTLVDLTCFAQGIGAEPVAERLPSHNHGVARTVYCWGTQKLIDMMLAAALTGVPGTNPAVAAQP